MIKLNNSKARYFDREISWLKFNERVLQEADDERNPLNERLKFLGIFSNNLDEFFRVRVATLRRLIELKKKNYQEDVITFEQSLNQVMVEVNYQQQKFGIIYENIIKQLTKHNIYLINEKELDEEQGTYVRSYFRDKIRHCLFPIMLKNFRAGTHLSDQAIYLAVTLMRTDNAEKDAYAIIEIPTSVAGRFIVLPEDNGKKYIIILDDVVRYCMDEIFARFKYDNFKAFTFKFTRDAELDIDNDVSKSFLEIMAESLIQRKRGSALRFVYDREMSEDLLKAVTSKLKVSATDNIVEGGRYHNFKDYMGFPNLGGSELEYNDVTPLPHKDIPEGSSIIRAIRKKDIMLHYPYQSFQYIVDLLREASMDPKVRSVKMTIYRVAKPSNIINALINAARNGKRVTVFMELQARFDEEANIYWSEKLQEAGVKVLHTIPGLKVHSKLILIKRKEGADYKYYANIGTGNFHEKTASLYADEALLTANKRITQEVDKVFDLFEASYRPLRFRTLIVSPFSTRNFFIRLINFEIANAKLNKEAWIKIKLNGLSDARLINKLYQASQEGVCIELIIRGICKLIPGIKGLSENIKVINIVDRYLEHSRVLIFCNGGDEKYFITSADWMVRNLDNRIEVTTPIFDQDIQKELKDILNIQLQDNIKARLLDNYMTNNYYQNKMEPIRAQVDTYTYLRRIHQ
ncbi:MAG: polyphosphate kinase 1 [Salinivirgaceae bacterium]|nr:polyphosphate kinase 1 [Salinivirgaceae bacterium]